MGLLDFFSKPTPSLLRLPSGSFTVDRKGAVLVSTVASSFPPELIDQISSRVLAVFKEATEAQLPLSQIVINYTSLKITARELRGGAIVFMSPRTPFSSTRQS
jgi:hypothetical protein